MSKNKIIEELKNLTTEERKATLIDIKSNFTVEMTGIEFNAGGKNNINHYYLSIWGQKANNNLGELINKLPNEIKNKMTMEKDLSVIHEVFKQGSMSNQFHNELINLLKKYLNTEQDTYKLQIKKVLDLLPFLNKKLLKIITILERFYTSNCFLPKNTIGVTLDEKEKEFIQYINNNLDFIKSITNDEIIILKEHNLLNKLPFIENIKEVTTIVKGGSDPIYDEYYDDSEEVIDITEQVQETSINWDFRPEQHIYEKEWLDGINTIDDINETLILANELNIYTLSSTAKILSKIYKDTNQV